MTSNRVGRMARGIPIFADTEITPEVPDDRSVRASLRGGYGYYNSSWPPGLQQVADIVGNVDSVLAQNVHRYHFQGVLMGCRQYHRRGDAVLVRV